MRLIASVQEVRRDAINRVCTGVRNYYFYVALSRYLAQYICKEHLSQCVLSNLLTPNSQT